jgi:metal-dependent amidase/aminoacylase/carboxypeptidase family protein
MSMFKINLSDDLKEHLVCVRHELHSKPELSGMEYKTAEYVINYLNRYSPPSMLLTNLGGTGIVAVYDSGKDGPNVLFRAELDALLIKENSELNYKSTVDGIAHR